MVDLDTYLQKPFTSQSGFSKMYWRWVGTVIALCKQLKVSLYLIKMIPLKAVETSVSVKRFNFSAKEIELKKIY